MAPGYVGFASSIITRRFQNCKQQSLHFPNSNLKLINFINNFSFLYQINSLLFNNYYYNIMQWDTLWF